MNSAEMNSTDPSQFPLLLEQLLEERIDVGSRALLISLMRADPALVEEASRHLVVSEALGRLQHAEDDETFVELVSAHAIRLGHMEESFFLPRIVHRFSRFAVAVLLAISGVPVFFY